MIEKSFYQILEEQAAAHPQQEAVVRGSVRITYAELVDRIDRMSALLQSRGLKKADKVVLWSGVSEDWICAYFAIIHAGGVAILLNPTLSMKDAAPQVQFADTAMAVFGRTHDTEGETSEIPTLAERFGLPQERMLCLNELAEAEAAEKLEGYDTDIAADAYVLYTSGTTAFPKAVMNSQHGMVNVCDRMVEAFGERLGCRVTLGVPLCHVYGLDGLMLYLYTGGTVVLPEVIKATEIANVSVREKTTVLWSVAVIYQGIVDSEELTAMLAPQIRMCTIAGSFTTPLQFMRYESALRNSVFINCYGMTETNGIYCMTRPEDTVRVRYHSVGRLLRDAEMVIWDAHRGIVPAGEIGEVLTRGFQMKNSYYKLEPEKQGFDEQGWFHSGDLGTLDEEGNLTIVGRSKDIIIKGGENIAPTEIEGAALGIPGVKECRVFGFHDRVYGENLGACVTLKPGEVFDEENARKVMRKAVGSYKSPVYYFIFEQFPMNANGKVDQRKLHTDMLTRLRRMQLGDELEKGVSIARLSIKNSTYGITPVATMMEQYATNLGFGKKKAARICLAMEEALIMRITEISPDIGNIDIELECFKGFLRVTVTDPCMVESRDRAEINRVSSAIILRMVDDVTQKQLDNGHYLVRMDFAYDREFDVQDFLLQHERIG